MQQFGPLVCPVIVGRDDLLEFADRRLGAVLGGYGHLGYRPILGQPSHTPRAHKVQIEKVSSASQNGGSA